MRTKRDMERAKRRVRTYIVIGLLIFGVLLSVLTLRKPDGVMRAFLAWTHREIEVPEMYGGFHLAFLAVLFASVGGVLGFGRRMPKEYLDDVVFSAGILLFFAELYKQLYYHTVLGNGHYNFGILPLQLCSYVLYLYLLLPLLPEGRGKRTLYLFAAFYQTAGGCVVMFCPLFYKELSLSLHTMLWHIVMVAVGLLILSLRGCGERYLPEILPAAAVFLAVYGFGMLLNVLLAPLTVHSPAPLNLFYLSPLEKTYNLIIADVRNAVGWFPAVVTYAVLLTAVCVNAIWLVLRAVRSIEKRVTRGKETIYGKDEEE